MSVPLGAEGDIDRRESRNKLRSNNFLFRVGDYVSDSVALASLLPRGDAKGERASANVCKLRSPKKYILMNLYAVYTAYMILFHDSIRPSQSVSQTRTYA